MKTLLLALSTFTLIGSSLPLIKNQHNENISRLNQTKENQFFLTDHITIPTDEEGEYYYFLTPAAVNFNNAYQFIENNDINNWSLVSYTWLVYESGDDPQVNNLDSSLLQELHDIMTNDYFLAYGLGFTITRETEKPIKLSISLSYAINNTEVSSLNLVNEYIWQDSIWNLPIDFWSILNISYNTN